MMLASSSSRTTPPRFQSLSHLEQPREMIPSEEEASVLSPTASKSEANFLFSKREENEWDLEKD